MSKYIKPTISLLSLNANAAAASTCSTSTAEAKDVMAMLQDMGFDEATAFGAGEGCENAVYINDYCKFTSSIQVFFS